MNDYDRQEDIAALHEPVFDIDEQIYWEENLEYGLEENMNA